MSTKEDTITNDKLQLSLFGQDETTPFEQIKHIDEYKQEYWSARELMHPLGYADWRNFLSVIDKAKTACQNSGKRIDYHFVDANKMVDLGSGSQRQVDDIKLSRYACYLIAQNGDSRKEEIAQAQTYFAVATRLYELIQKLPVSQRKDYLRARHSGYSHEEALRWVEIRQDQKDTGKELRQEWSQRGVEKPVDYARLQNDVVEAAIGETTTDWKKRTGIDDTPRNHVSSLENLLIEQTQRFARWRHIDMDSHGVDALEDDIDVAGQAFDREGLKRLATPRQLELPEGKKKQRKLLK